MSGLTLENANILMKKYEPLIVRTLSEGAVTHQDFQTRPWKGDACEVHINARRNAGVGANTAGGAWKEAGHVSHLKAQIYRSFVDGAISLDDAIEAAAQGEGAVQEATAQEIAGVTESMSYLLNSIAFGDGSGKVGSLNADISTNLIVIDHTDLFLPQLLNWPGAKLDVYDGNTFMGTVEIGKMGNAAGAGNSVGLAASGEIQFEVVAGHGVDADSGDDLYWKGTSGSSFGLMPNGFNSLIDDIDATFQNIDTGEHPQYTSYVDANGGTPRAPDVEMFQRVLANLRLKSGIPNQELITYMNPATMAMLDRIEGTLERYFVNDRVVGRAVDGVQTNQGKVMPKAVNACPDNQAFLVDKSQLVRYVQKEVGFVRRGGNVLWPSTTSKQFIGHLHGIFENAIMARNTSARIDDLDATAMRRVSFS